MTGCEYDIKQFNILDDSKADNLLTKYVKPGFVFQEQELCVYMCDYLHMGPWDKYKHAFVYIKVHPIQYSKSMRTLLYVLCAFTYLIITLQTL